MRFHALATDYDGTLAHHGRVDDATVSALERVRKSGRKLILVSGRELADLQTVFSRFDLFDLAVLENGALLYDPAAKEVRVLAEPPPRSFADALRARGVEPVSTGHVIVATWEPHQETVLQVIRDQGLELQVIFNKGAVMVLPSGVNKATGLAAALAQLRLSPHNAIGVGDAENDHAFLRTCECSAAVANALPAVKDTADIVLNGDHGAGVAELIDRLIASDLSDLRTLSRHHITVGVAEGGGGADATIDPASPGVLVAGTSGSGKSTATTGILEQLALADYQSLVIDPEGDYTTLDFAMHLGNPQQAPRPEDITDALKDPRRSIVMNLLGIPLADRPAFFERVLSRVLEEKARTGRPHWLVVDETHHLIPVGADADRVASLLPDRGLMFVTVHPGAVAAPALAKIGTLLVIGANPAKTIAEFCRAVGDREPRIPRLEVDRLGAGDAILWRRGSRNGLLIHTQPPRSERKRHSRKYVEGNLGPERSFYFRGPEGKLNLKASNLHMFVQLAAGVDDDTWEFHRQNGDYSKWVRAQIKDEELADELAAIERGDSSAPDSRAAVRAAIETRYTLPDDGGRPNAGGA